MLARRFIDAPDIAARAGPHNGDAGRIVDSLHGSEVGESAPERNTRTHALCRDTTGYNTDRAGILRFLSIDLNVKASRRCYDAERVDPPTPGVSGVEPPPPPQRRYRAERRSEVGEMRRPKTDQISLRIITGILILIRQKGHL